MTQVNVTKISKQNKMVIRIAKGYNTLKILLKETFVIDTFNRCIYKNAC